MITKINYQKFRWFYTSSGKLVIGGKSAEQNDSLVKEMIKQSQEMIVMHTSTPGSPFSFIISEVSEVNEKDLEECAIFTGCFSRVWRSGEKKAKIDIFKISQLSKSKVMKTGTWAVIGKNSTKNVELKLALVTQNEKLRAVPLPTLKNKKPILIITPGKTPKEEAAESLIKTLANRFTREEILSALPTGGIKINDK